MGGHGRRDGLYTETVRRNSSVGSSGTTKGHNLALIRSWIGLAKNLNLPKGSRDTELLKMKGHLDRIDVMSMKVRYDSMLKIVYF
jgi:hypothetical protein